MTDEPELKNELDYTKEEKLPLYLLMVYTLNVRYILISLIAYIIFVFYFISPFIDYKESTRQLNILIEER